MKRFITYSVSWMYLCLVFWGITAKAETEELHQIDSIKERTRIETNQEHLVGNYNDLAALYGTVDIDSSIYYCQKAKAVAKRIDYREGLAIAHLYTGRGLVEKSRFIDAIEQYNRGLELFITLNDSLNILYCYRALGYVYSYAASQLKCLDYNFKALAIAEAIKDTVSRSICYNNIATIYRQLDDYESAMYYFEKSLAIEKQVQVPCDLAICYSNMGFVKVENRKYEEASADYEALQKLMPCVENPYLMSYFNLSLSGYHNALGNHDSTRYYIDRAAQLCKKYDFTHIMARVYRKEGELYLKQQQYLQCITSLDNCLELSETIGMHEAYDEIYQMKAQAYAQLGFFRAAYENMQLANRAVDSLKNKKVATLLGKFEKEQAAKNEMERHHLEHELKDEKAEKTAIILRHRFNFALLGVVLLFITVTVMVYSFLKVKRKSHLLKEQHRLIQEQKGMLEENLYKLEQSETQLQKLIAAKDKFFSIIAHDLKSPFNSIMGLSDELALHYSEYDDKERKEMIGVVSKTSKSTLFLLENLLSWACSQSGTLRLNKEVHLLKPIVDESISVHSGAAGLKGLKIKNEIDATLNVIVDRESIKVVIVNLFCNAIKFSSQGELITFGCQLNGRMVDVSVRDEGIGMDDHLLKRLFSSDENVQRPGTSNEKGTGLGLLLCREFVQKNGGEIWAESQEGQGSRFCFSLPLATKPTPS